MPGWEPFDMGGTAAWPLPVVVAQPVALSVVVSEVTFLTAGADE